MSIDAIAYVKSLPVGDPTSRLLMWSIAENTFNDSFRCKVGNLVLAEDVGVHERTVMRHLQALEDVSKFIRRHPQCAASGRGNDHIEIIGFEAWLLANRPHRARRAVADHQGGSADSQPDNLSGGVEGGESLSDNGIDDATPMSGPPDNLPTGQFAHRATVSGGNKEKIRTLETDSPLTPRPAGGTRSLISSSDRKRLQLIDTLRADGTAPHVVEHLLAPLLSQRRLSDPDPLGAMRRVRDAAADLTLPVLAAAAADVLKACKAKFRPGHVTDAIAARRKMGMAFVIKPGMPEWKRWSEYWARHDPKRHGLMQRIGVSQEQTQWPPPASAGEQQQPEAAA